MNYFKPKYEKWNFPAGEVGVKILEFQNAGIMLLDYQQEPNLMVWFQIIDSYNRHVPNWERKIFIPYLPYTRQDKIHKWGEAVSIDLLGKIFETLEISVITLDPHISIYWASNQITPSPSSSLLELYSKYNYWCFPDKNASQHGLEALYYRWPLSTNNITQNKIYMGKVRNKNGDISLKMLTENLSFNETDNILINDDICDGGLTFTTAAQLLQEKGAKNISLFVTHGIFSKGLEPLYESGIQHIYTTNSYCKLSSNEKLTIIDILGEK